MPLPTTVPSAATSTASPASKSPSTATIPTGSRLEPRSRRTRAAPSSTSEAPVGRLRVLEPELEARGLAGAGRRSGCRPVRPRPPRRGCRPRSRCRSPPGCRPRSPSRRRRPCCASRPSRRPRCGRRSPSRRARRSPRPRRPARRSGRCAGRRREDAVDVGEQDEQAGVEQDRDLGGEEVVVAEGDLVGGGGVVLVDDRDHPPLDQPAQGLARVQVVGAGGDVGRGQQHLGGARAAARRAAARRRGRGRPGRPPRRPAARPSPAAAPAAPSAACRGRSRPEVTITTRSPPCSSAATCSQTESSTSARSSPSSAATIEEPSLTTRVMAAQV